MTSATNQHTVEVGNLSELIGDWAWSLAASNHSPRTIEIDTTAANRLLRFLRSNPLPTSAPEIKRQHVEAYFTSELAELKPATVSQRYRARGSDVEVDGGGRRGAGQPVPTDASHLRT